MRREDVLEVMRKRGNPAPIWAGLGSGAKLRACTDALRATCLKVLEDQEMVAVEKSASKPNAKPHEIYYQAAMMAIFKKKPSPEEARNAAYYMADKIAMAYSVKEPDPEPEIAAPAAGDGGWDKEAEEAREAGAEVATDDSPYGDYQEEYAASVYPEDEYPDEDYAALADAVQEGREINAPDRGAEDEDPDVEAPDADLAASEQAPAKIDPILLKGEPVRQDVPQSEIDTRHRDVEVTERAGFSTAELPDKRPLVMMMLPPPPGPEADPEEISKWSASEPWGPFCVGYKHAEGRGPRDVEVMDAEVAFYNGPEVILQDTGMPQRLDGAEPGADAAARKLFVGDGEVGEEVLREFETCYDEAQKTWNPAHARALAWSGADLIVPDTLRSALGVIADAFPETSEPERDPKSRLTDDAGEAGWRSVIWRACALHTSRGMPLGEALLTASFEAGCARLMASGKSDLDAAQEWASFLDSPAEFILAKTPEPTI